MSDQALTPQIGNISAIRFQLPVLSIFALRQMLFVEICIRVLDLGLKGDARRKRRRR